MKLWLVPMCELDTRRLRAQHGEYHYIAGSIARGRRWLGWQLAAHRDALVEYHELIEKEFAERELRWSDRNCAELLNALRSDPWVNMYGGWPQSPYEDPEHRERQTVLRDRERLVGRWDGSFRGRQVASDEAAVDYARIMQAYREAGGCDHRYPDDWQRLDKEHDLCLLCKRFKRNRETGLWSLR